MTDTACHRTELGETYTSDTHENEVTAQPSDRHTCSERYEGDNRHRGIYQSVCTS